MEKCSMFGSRPSMAGGGTAAVTGLRAQLRGSGLLGELVLSFWVGNEFNTGETPFTVLNCEKNL